MYAWHNNSSAFALLLLLDFSVCYYEHSMPSYTQAGQARRDLRQNGRSSDVMETRKFSSCIKENNASQLQRSTS